MAISEKTRRKFDKVKCWECGRRFRAITNTHLELIHGMTVQEYKEKWPHATLVARQTRRLRARLPRIGT